MRLAITLAVALSFGLLAGCSDDDPVAVVVEEEEPFDSIGTDCVPVDTVGTHVPVICT